MNHSMPVPGSSASALDDAIARQRVILHGWLASLLTQLAEECLASWEDPAGLERRLVEGIAELPYCKYLYLLDAGARQISATVSRTGLLNDQIGRDRSGRPYMVEALAGRLFSLSEAYISRNARRPSLTAVRRIEDVAGRLLGYLGADFDLRELPATQDQYRQPGQWM